MTTVKDRPKPVLLPELCKGCGRCIEACPKHCITLGEEINQTSGLVPVVIDYDVCNGCGLCISACPEPYGLTTDGYELEDPAKLFGAAAHHGRSPAAVEGRTLPLPKCEPLVLKGNYAAAVGALLAGCRHVFGYPITPSTEGAELMAKFLPKLDGVFMQAVSEVATVNHMYGCGGAGLPCMTFTSSPGLSLMLEGISYMIGAEVPAVFVNVMRGGPGLGNIGPSQADIKLLCRGLGHGNTHAIVLAPSTPQEMLDLTMEAFRLAFKYRNPVFVAPDGYLGQMTGRVQLPEEMIVPGVPSWAVFGDEVHRGNLINSIYLAETDLHAHNEKLQEKYALITANEQRATTYRAEDAKVLVVAASTPARMAKSAIEHLRQEGHKVGLFSPVTLWPFPIDALRAQLDHVEDIVVVEASAGQLEDELRLALSHAGLAGVRIHNLRRMGGLLPQEPEIRERIHAIIAEAA
ncbi:MAG: 3-methyl-2-oxobutanoate dehydrogenase subunit VorB [Deltaproteobacteria bacterium]|nr:MAG: 3-methyl-2-oxobutanoate dehydrogenase subunit VorB [Deltaproteobacteria bacterium]